MGDLTDEILVAFELHSPERIRSVLAAGLDAQAEIRGKSLVDWLLEMYTRSERLPECLDVLLSAGATLRDPELAPVLLDDGAALEARLAADPVLLEHRTHLRSAFTPLAGASLLHVAAEYGNLRVARVLVDRGADVEAHAAVDEHGFDGHTPLFHTVNAPVNHSRPILELLLDAGARTDVRLPGLTWGRGFEWETVLYDVTPISYAQCGLLPQFHRREEDVLANVQRLLHAARRSSPPVNNVPNRYLHPRSS